MICKHCHKKIKPNYGNLRNDKLKRYLYIHIESEHLYCLFSDTYAELQSKNKN